jgi:hypothetical protein
VRRDGENKECEVALAKPKPSLSNRRRWWTWAGKRAAVVHGLRKVIDQWRPIAHERVAPALDIDDDLAEAVSARMIWRSCPEPKDRGLPGSGIHELQDI